MILGEVVREVAVMSTSSRRHPDAAHPFEQPDRKGPNGRGLCRWCWYEIPTGRRSWCSQACVTEYLDFTDWKRIRANVFKRDRGRCQLCGLDLAKIERVLRWSMRWCKRWDSHFWPATALSEAGVEKEWQADHIKPRADGGGDDLDNLRTLCDRCHAGVTAEFARERARRRRNANATLFAAAGIAALGTLPKGDDQ